MEVKIFQTKEIGFIVTEVIESDLDNSCVKSESCCKSKCEYTIRNPRYLHIQPSPDAETGQVLLKPTLVPMVYAETLINPSEGYVTTVNKCQYKDVTDKFLTDIVEVYKSVEGSIAEHIEESEAVSEEAVNNVVSFNEE